MPSQQHQSQISPQHQPNLIHHPAQFHHHQHHSISMPPLQNHQVQTEILSYKFPQATDERRHSLQIPPYPTKHKKNDSYDSQTSLSTLADIAASSTREDEVLNSLLNDLESILIKFESLNKFINEIHDEFYLNLENSKHDGHEDTELSLKNKYSNFDSIKLSYLKKFLNNLSVSKINDSIKINDDILKFLNDCLIEKEKLTNLKLNENQVNLVKKQLNRSASKKTHLRHDSKIIKKFNHQRNQSINEIQSSSSIPIIKKRRQSIKSNFENLLDEPHDLETICKQCGSDDTPEWRKGPYGSRSLCNACGLFFTKLVKKFGGVEAARIMIQRRNQGNGDDRRIPTDH